MSEKTIIEARNLELYYGDNHALKSVSLEIPENRITALIGPSGCGKSTFLKTLNRMNDLVPGVRIEGEVLYNGENIYPILAVESNEPHSTLGLSTTALQPE